MKLILSSDQDKIVELNAALIEISKRERLRLALKTFSLFFGLAFVSIFVPVLHFFLVPLFLIVSIPFSYRAYATQYRLNLKDPAKCVLCGQPLPLQFSFNDDLRLKCDSCFSHYRLDPKN